MTFTPDPWGTQAQPGSAQQADATAPASDAVQPATPAGWYPDPSQPNVFRYWDGSAWTTHTTPSGAGAAAAGPAGAREPKRFPRGAWVAIGVGAVVAVGALAAIIVPQMIEVGEEVAELASGEIVTEEELDEVAQDLDEQFGDLDWQDAVASAPPAVAVAGGQSTFQPPAAWVEVPDTSAMTDSFGILGSSVELPGIWATPDGGTVVMILGFNMPSTPSDMEAIMEGGRAQLSPTGDATLDELEWTQDSAGRDVLLGSLSAVIDGYDVYGTCALISYDGWVVEVIASGIDPQATDAATHAVLDGLTDG